MLDAVRSQVGVGGAVAAAVVVVAVVVGVVVASSTRDEARVASGQRWVERRCMCDLFSCRGEFGGFMASSFLAALD